MITINRNNPTSGEITSSLTNSTDAAGLHFDGTSGNIDIASPPDLGTKFSFEFVVQADEWETTGTDGSFLIDFYSTGNRFYLGNIANYSSYNMGIIDNGSIVNFGVKVLDDLKVHHLVMTVDGVTVKLFDNGNQVGDTLTISASHDIDDSTVLKLGIDQSASTQWAFNGTIYRARLWNKTLSQTDVTSVYESASLDFADQWGSQTKVIDANFNSGYDGWNTANTWATQTNTASAMQLAASAADQYCRNSASFTAGKRYLVEYTATALTSTVVFSTHNGSAYADLHTITAGSNSFELVWPSGNGLVYIRSGTTTSAVTLDDVFITAIGCVSDFDFSYANPTQSNIVRNRSDAGDGTAAGGVVQITPIDQLNVDKLSVGGTTPLVGIGLAAGTAPDHLLHMANVDGGSLLKLQRTEGNDGIASFNIGGGDPGFNLVVSGTSGDFTVATGGAERMRIDSTGNVGVGASSPSSFYSLADDIVIGSGVGGRGLTIYSGADSSGYIGFNDTASASMQAFIQYNHDGDYMVFAPNGSEKMRISSAGAVTMPTNPAFSVKLSADQVNIATTGVATVLFNTERFDQGANFNTSTYTFTAPVTGKYQLCAHARLDNVDTAASFYQLTIATSNKDYPYTVTPKFTSDVSYMSVAFSVLADMDAADTAYVTVAQSGGTSQTDIEAIESYFSGFLAC
tara:strand:+ start:708 stop:2759 length:2052 start_codon:yes stop_codon:yes gene_type:complete